MRVKILKKCFVAGSLRKAGDEIMVEEDQFCNITMESLEPPEPQKPKRKKKSKAELEAIAQKEEAEALEAQALADAEKLEAESAREAVNQAEE